MLYTIYQTTDLTNNFIYIGMHQTKDLNDEYLGSGKRLKRAIKSHGVHNFKKEILHTFLTEQEMKSKEKEIVTPEFLKRPDVYNLCPGGEGGWGYINKNKLGVCENQKRSIKREYGVKGGVSTSNKLKTDRVFAEKRNLKISETIKQSYKNGRINGFAGKHVTEEHKQKIRNKNTQMTGVNNVNYGTCWITNGKENKKIKKELLDKYIEMGYNRGRIC